MHAFLGEGRKRDKRKNGQTHISGWVENVTNGRMDKRTVKMGTHRRTDGHTHTHTNGKLFSKVVLQLAVKITMKMS